MMGKMILGLMKDDNLVRLVCIVSGVLVVGFLAQFSGSR
jgi:hypothetical protein